MGHLFRKANMADIDGIMSIIDFARRQMLKQGMAATRIYNNV